MSTPETKTGKPDFSGFPVFYPVKLKATGQSRTDDLRFTKASLYQLSYGGEVLGDTTVSCSLGTLSGEL